MPSVQARTGFPECGNCRMPYRLDRNGALHHLTRTDDDTVCIKESRDRSIRQPFCKNNFCRGPVHWEVIPGHTQAPRLFALKVNDHTNSYHHCQTR